jgi:hypothetical protein
LGFPPPTHTRRESQPRRAETASAGRALDVVVEAFDDVSGGGFFEVGLFEAEDLVFELSLKKGMYVSRDYLFGLARARREGFAELNICQVVFLSRHKTRLPSPATHHALVHQSLLLQ